MAPRGMVRALKDARRVLTENGLVVEVHPEPAEPIVLSEAPAGRLIVGRLRRHNDAYRAAEARLQRVIQLDLFRLRDSVLFTSYSTLPRSEACARSWPGSRPDRQWTGPRSGAFAACWDLAPWGR